jgi:hypothetical protein
MNGVTAVTMVIFLNKGDRHMRYSAFLTGLLLCANVWSYTEGDVTAAQLLAIVNGNAQLISETKNAFQTDEGSTKNISMYQLTAATTWTADMDIDCDGAQTTNCNLARDPWYQNQTSCCGGSVAAENTPYFVIPIGSPANSSSRGIAFGQVAAIIYKNQVVYAMFADECGVSTVIGEASYATANLLGIDPDPQYGGTNGPVTYIVFTGTSGRLASADRANHQKAIDLGVVRAKQLLQDYATILCPVNAQRSYNGWCEITARSVIMKSAGAHSIAVYTPDGRTVTQWSGAGARTYVMPQLNPGLYIVKARTAQGSFVRRLAID